MENQKHGGLHWEALVHTFANIIHEGWGFIPGCSRLQAASSGRMLNPNILTEQQVSSAVTLETQIDGSFFVGLLTEELAWGCFLKVWTATAPHRAATQLYSVNSAPDLVSTPAPADFSTKMMVISECFILNDLLCWGKLVFCLSLRCGSMGMKSHIWPKSLNYSYCYKDISMPHNPYKLSQLI